MPVGQRGSWVRFGRVPLLPCQSSLIIIGFAAAGVVRVRGRRVGFLLAVGKGRERPEAVTELLDAAAPRTARVETAPARGLFLHKVFYGKIPA